MKRFRVFLIVLLIAVIGLAVAYSVIQRWATQRMTATLRERAKAVVQNPENLTITNAPVQVVGPQHARIPQMEISGDDLVMSRQMTVKSARVVLHDVELQGKSPKVTHFSAGTFAVTLTDAAVSQYLQRQPDYARNGVTVLANKLTVHFRNGAVQAEGEALLPHANRRSFTMHGDLVPAADGRGIRCAITRVEVPGLANANPHLLGDIELGLSLRELLPTAADGRITTVKVGEGTLDLSGTLDSE